MWVSTHHHDLLPMPGSHNKCGKPPPMARGRSTSSVITMANLGWASLGLRRQVASRFSQLLISPRARMPSVNGFWGVSVESVSIICSSCMRSSSTACSTPMFSTSTEPGRIKGSGSRFQSRKLGQRHPIVRSIQLGAYCLKRSLADLSCSCCMPSLMVCCPYTRVFSCAREPFPSSIDG